MRWRRCAAGIRCWPTPPSSTLPGAQLAKFPATGAVEIHLALAFNNLIFDHPSLPAALKREILQRWPGRFLEVYGRRPETLSYRP